MRNYGAIVCIGLIRSPWYADCRRSSDIVTMGTEWYQRAYSPNDRPYSVPWYQRVVLIRSATTFRQMLGSSGSIKKWRKHPRVGENIEKNSLKVIKKYFQKKITKKFQREREKEKFTHKKAQTQYIHKCSLTKWLLFRRKKQGMADKVNPIYRVFF